MAGSSTKAIVAALVGNALIAVTKFTAAAVTGSSAMFSEGIHSVVDTGNQVLLLFGLRQASKPPDQHFPFGHGKEVYFWSFVVAIIIFALGAGVSIYEGVEAMRHPSPVENAVVNYVVLCLAILFEGFAWAFAFREFNKSRGELGYFEAVRKGKDPTMFVVLFEDTAAMLGLLVALAGIALAQTTGNLYFDGLASIAIGAILAVTAAWLAYETKGLLIGESANRPVVEGIRRLARARSEIVYVNEVLTMHMGPAFILVNLSADFKDGLPAGQIERTIAALDRQIKREYPEVQRVFVEAESKPAPQPQA
ncbi:MAG: cation diffusion facilitator family transporter [Gammaproteobacteria bacterium]|nr:cation diffusion facilitator family transporter [Gammaproteobacteria bacterium]